MKRTRSPTPPHLRIASPPPNAGLYIEAVEAELIHNDSLEQRTTARSNQPPGLLQWSGDATEWIDRYDILNLLDELPALQPLSPTRSDGFSDLPSDGEEMFYFEQEVREEIEKEKKKRRLESVRAERMRLIEEREAVPVLSDQPTEIQLTLMTRLHATLLASPNPTLLEIRILANHAADARFGFLRRGGQYRAIWEKMRTKVEEKEAVNGGLGGLAGYGSDSDGDEVEKDEEVEAVEEAAILNPIEKEGSEEATAERLKKSAKLAKALAWAAARRSDRESAAK